MATEQHKSSNPGGQEHLQPHPPVVYPPQQFNGHYPPPTPYGPFYTYAPIPEGAHDPNMANGAPPPGPYLMAYPPPPPGMIFAYPGPPPGQAYPPYPPGMPPAQNAPRPKRKQVKMACTNCAGACKRCDEARPCERCVKYGIAETCVDGVRKERKKGIKRGPYKRKNRAQSAEQSAGNYPAQANGEGDSSTPPAPYPAPPEAYYHPYFYPHGYVPPGHDVHPHPEGAPNGNSPVPHPPYYPMHPVYAPYPPYPAAGPIPYAPPTVPAPSGGALASTNGKAEQSSATGETNGDTPAAPIAKSKKRSRAKNGDDGGTKARKTKYLSSDSQTDGDAGRGKDLHLGTQSEAGSVFNGMDNRTMMAV